MASSIYSVKQINKYIKTMFDQDFLLSRVSIRGELSSLKFHPSGHVYMTLKEGDALLSVIMFRSDRVRGIQGEIKEGMQVIISGHISVFENTGKYQLYAKTIKPDGEGDSYLKFLALKDKLEKMGLFSEEHKKPIPKYAMKVGIVSSMSGAGFKDIVKMARERNPYVELILSNALVQGENAPESVVKAIELLDHMGCDVMIVGRGGGAKEELDTFNDERIAMAIYHAKTPVISAVGHEIDFTIADFVADFRAITPTNAAEIAIFSYEEYMNEMRAYLKDMANALTNEIHSYKQIAEKNELKLKLLHPKNKLKENEECLSDYKERLITVLTNVIDEKKMNLSEMDLKMRNFMGSEMTEKRHLLSLMAERLNGKNPLLKLVNGYGYVSVHDEPLKDLNKVNVNDELVITMHDGKVITEVKEICHGRKEEFN